MTGHAKPSTHRAAGGCLCGAVRYEVRGPLRSVVNCHCGQCRRIHGHYGAYTAAARGDLVVTADQGIKWYASSATARRGFCAECGASLFWDGTGRGHIAVAAGSLDDYTGLEILGHIYVADKGAYYQIEDGLPQRPQG